MVIELLGKSLATHFREKRHRFEVPETAFLIKSSIALLETLHRHAYIHRDLKPHNLTMGPTATPN
jgi:serine/threonine protein kinase